MNISSGHNFEAERIIALFVDTFSTSENEQEGEMIGSLVAQLLDEEVGRTENDRQGVKNDSILGYVAYEDNNELLGAIMLSKITFKQPVVAYLLSPVAVASEQQGKGIGKALIRHAIDRLTQSGANLLITYGDPAFYGKVGFEPVTVDKVAAPFELNQPIGWLAQALNHYTLDTPLTHARCTAAFNNPNLW